MYEPKSSLQKTANTLLMLEIREEIREFQKYLLPICLSLNEPKSAQLLYISDHGWRQDF